VDAVRLRLRVRQADGNYLPGVQYQLQPVTIGGICSFSRPLADGGFGLGVGRVVAIENSSPEPLVTIEELSEAEEARYWEQAGVAPHRLKLLSAEGLREGGTLVTRARQVGSLINIPSGPNPERGLPVERTKGHVWRVVAVEPERVLVLEYVKPWGEGDPRCCD
jgi:hypothetical protein